MTDRALVSEVVQVGFEDTAGTAVPASKVFQGISIELDSAVEMDEFGPAGQIPQSLLAERREWSTGKLTGYPTYNELAYLMSALLGAADVSTPGSATGRKWVWTPDASTPWVPKTMSIERGVHGGTAEKCNYGVINGLTIGFSRTDSPSLDGDLFARRLDYAATLTAASAVSAMNNVPILPGQIDVYMDDTGAGIGVSQLTRDFNVEFHFTDLFDMIWPLNSSLNSFAGHTLKKPDIGMTLQLGNDAVGRGLIDELRSGETKFFRVKCTGPTIEPGINYLYQWDTAAKVMDAPSRGDANSLSTLEWTLRTVLDATWAKYVEVTAQVDFASL